MTCSSCYEVQLPNANCSPPIEVSVGLAASTSYKVRITDKFSNEYFLNVTTDGAGNFDLNLRAIDGNLFTPYSGTFILSILDAQGKIVNMTIAGDEYTCVSMSFFNTNVPEVYLNPAIPDPADAEVDPVPASFTNQEMEYTAAENIAAYQVITSEFKVGNSATVADANKMLALSVTTTNSGNKGLAVVNGMVINPAWTWTIDADIYLNGTSLSETAPTTGFAVIIGKASRADAIVVNIGTPTLL